MNASRAKKIRKRIYGNLSRRLTEYSILEHVKKFFKMDDAGKKYEMKKVTGQLLCRGFRKQYKEAKRAWKEGLRHGEV